MKNFFKEGKPFHGFDDTIDEMFEFDSSLKDREILVKTSNMIERENKARMHPEMNNIPRYTVEELKELNKDVKYKYSTSSLAKLASVHKDIAFIFVKAANSFDIRIVSGYRSPEEQYDLFVQGRSTKDGYTKRSRHQSGLAVDAVPVPKGINMYKNTKENALRWAFFVGFIKALGVENNIKVRSGWKWRINPTDSLVRSMSQNSFPDSNHFEVVL